ncbi:MAG: hypothetical protein V1848_00645 [Candidatus Magasanikbacteria bacterium]
MEQQESHQDVMSELQVLWQEAYQLGNNDYESGDIRKIIDDVMNRRMNPEEGLKRARKIIESKNLR